MLVPSAADNLGESKFPEACNLPERIRTDSIPPAGNSAPELGHL